MTRYRVPNLVMRIYRRSRAWALAFFAISVALIFYVRLNTCAAYIETFLGLAPINLILTGLALTGAFLAMPIRPNTRPEALQVSSASPGRTSTPVCLMPATAGLQLKGLCPVVACQSVCVAA